MAERDKKVGLSTLNYFKDKFTDKISEDINQLSEEVDKKARVYFGSGDIPEGYNIQVIDDGDTHDLVYKYELNQACDQINQEIDKLSDEIKQNVNQGGLAIDDISNNGFNELEIVYSDGEIDVIDLNIIPSGKVGQIIEIEEVDEHGRPYKYKAVNKPSGGSNVVVVQDIYKEDNGIGFCNTDGEIHYIDLGLNKMSELFPLTHFQTENSDNHEFVSLEGLCFNLLYPLVDGKTYTIIVDDENYEVMAEKDENGVHLKVENEYHNEYHDFSITYNEDYIDLFGYNTMYRDNNWDFNSDDDGGYLFKPVTIAIYQDSLEKMQEDIAALYELNTISSYTELFPLTHFDTVISDNHDFDSADGSILINLSEPIEIGAEYLVKLNDVEYKVVATPQRYSGKPTLDVEGEIEIIYSEDYVEDLGFNTYVLYTHTDTDGDDYILTPYTLGVHRIGEQSIKNATEKLQKEVDELKIIIKELKTIIEVLTAEEILPLTHFKTEEGEGYYFESAGGLLCFDLPKPLVQGETYQVTVNGESYNLDSKKDGHEIVLENDSFSFKYSENFIEELGYNTVFIDSSLVQDDGDYIFEPVSLCIKKVK